MKYRITLKDPDGFGNFFQETAQERERLAIKAGLSEDELDSDRIQEKIQEDLAPWVDCQEYVTIEIDTEAGTTRVLKVGE